MALKRTRISAGLHSSHTSAGTVVTGLTAAGSTQATALAVTADVNIISTAAASTGVRLPDFDVDDEIIVVNGGANALAVYPPVGHSINVGAINVAVSLPVGRRATFLRVTNTLWVADVSA